MKRGIVERFGEETLTKVNKLGQVPQKVRTSLGGTIDFVLTKRDIEERVNLDMQAAVRK